MTTDGPEGSGLIDSAGTAQPIAWQPFTARGVAAFAHASLGRLLLVELIIASVLAAAAVWFFGSIWFPTVRQAIRRLPDAGAIRNQELQSPLVSGDKLAENRPFLIIVLDLETRRNASQT